jgi:integrase
MEARLKELLAFGRVIAAEAGVLDHVRTLKNGFVRQAAAGPKRKQEVIRERAPTLTEAYGRAEALHEAAAALPAHLVTAGRHRREAALLALSVNAPLRIADLHRLRLGVEIVRDAEGWRMSLRQSKTGVAYAQDRLWDLTGACLDALVLGGQPASWLGRQLDALEDSFLFSRDGGRTPLAIAWPSQVWQRHFGVSEHIVRTLWATAFAERDAENAPWAAPALLGHGSGRSRKHYEVGVRRGSSVRAVQAAIEAMLADESEDAW